MDIAGELKQNPNVEIFTIGVGDGISRKDLSAIASKSTEKSGEHIFQLPKYDDFPDLMNKMTNKGENLCRLNRESTQLKPGLGQVKNIIYCTRRFCRIRFHCVARETMDLWAFL